MSMHAVLVSLNQQLLHLRMFVCVEGGGGEGGKRKLNNY